MPADVRHRPGRPAPSWVLSPRRLRWPARRRSSSGVTHSRARASPCGRFLQPGARPSQSVPTRRPAHPRWRSDLLGLITSPGGGPSGAPRPPCSRARRLAASLPCGNLCLRGPRSCPRRHVPSLTGPAPNACRRVTLAEAGFIRQPPLGAERPRTGFAQKIPRRPRVRRVLLRRARRRHGADVPQLPAPPEGVGLDPEQRRGEGAARRPRIPREDRAAARRRSPRSSTSS